MNFNRWQGPVRLEPNGARITRLALVADEDAPARARIAIGPAVDHPSEDVVERATLLTSEVVTNSVLHSGSGEVRLAIWAQNGSIAVSVCDDGEGFAPVALPGTIADGNGDGGFGLALLDTLSEAWGCGHDVETWVWFQVSPR